MCEIRITWPVVPGRKLLVEEVIKLRFFFETGAVSAKHHLGVYLPKEERRHIFEFCNTPCLNIKFSFVPLGVPTHEQCVELFSWPVRYL